jgi:hypothetical protein
VRTAIFTDPRLRIFPICAQGPSAIFGSYLIERAQVQRGVAMNATVMTADGRLARIVLFRTEVLSEQDYECRPINQLTFTEVQELAKALRPPSVTTPLMRRVEGRTHDTRCCQSDTLRVS